MSDSAELKDKIYDFLEFDRWRSVGQVWRHAYSGTQANNALHELIYDGLIVLEEDDHLYGTVHGFKNAEDRQYFIDSNGIDMFGDTYMYNLVLCNHNFRKLTPHEIVIVKTERKRRAEIEQSRREYGFYRN